ncbi:ABC transporter permease [Mesoterricola sediminis]|uniref:ABC transporter permease n=1 Tax=Mesoterricola sediminis TaxID=2927980 RepID=A0AA48GZ68_9BACT|nr:ABC transporter permease subunit [Mesoterricola sediminis]BDU78325.1 ABC transporter permease [Mesoterricola sediminis]
MLNRLIDTVWGQANTLFYPFRRRRWVDLVVILAGLALLFGLVQLGQQWTGAKRPVVEINLSPWSLPLYTFFSMMRGLAAYVISLGFTLVYAYWAAKDSRAEKLLVPLLDILQSIPVLGFMPGLILALVAVFPHSNLGLELAAVLMIFTGQAWNMTFSLYHSLKSVPQDLQEAGTVYRFTWWQRLKWVELPYGTTGLVWNSMMSMAGGWFFLMITEAFRMGDQDFRLPGLGSYMSVAVDKGNGPAMLAAVIAMVAMIVFLDQILWRPVVVWAQRFRVEETAQVEAPRSWLLRVLRRSRLVRILEARASHRRHHRKAASPVLRPRTIHRASQIQRWIANGALAALLLVVVWGAVSLVHYLSAIRAGQWLVLLRAGGLTLSRVLASTALGTLWAVPAGLAIGLSPRLSRILQPVVQVAASFPAPMLFPVVIAFLAHLHVGMGYGCILLMLLGTQWYILFNVIAGAMAIPGDLKEAAVCFRLSPWQRFKALYLPATFPYLVTGWVTAAGGAWNASIVAEYYDFHGQTLKTFGLGATVSQAFYERNLTLLAAGVLLMSAIVVLFNRIVWKPCYKLAHTRYSLTK